jgi:hypothetical protein
MATVQWFVQWRHWKYEDKRVLFICLNRTNTYLFVERITLAIDRLRGAPTAISFRRAAVSLPARNEALYDAAYDLP